MGYRKSERRDRTYKNGSDHPSWLGGNRGPKRCGYCKREYSKGPTTSITVFWNQKFCSKLCSDKGGFRYSGENHPSYRENARRRNRGGSHHKWANAVIGRDKSTCQSCGESGVELHAHHIKPYKDYPELRFDVDNGLTLCFKCHWNLHAAQNEKAVNSVEPRTDNAEGNTEPSERRNVLEGVTTRGRAYRRWQGQCDQCSTFITKALSDTKGKKHLFCSGTCRSRFALKNFTKEHRNNFAKAKLRIPGAATRAKMSAAQRKRYAKAVNSSTSAAPEREDIV